MTARDRTGKFTAERTTTTVTERLTIEPAGLPSMAPAWAALTAPLQHYRVPVIVTDAERAASDAYRDHLRARGGTDRDDVTQWHAQARLATFGPLDDWLLLHRPSDEAVDAYVKALVPLPAMMP